MRLEVEKCCWYFDLRSGCIAILIYQIVAYCLGLITAFVPELSRNVANLGPVTTAIVNILSLIAAGAALYGILKEKPKFIYPWIIFVGIGIVGALIAIIGSFIDRHAFPISAGQIPIILISCVISFYFGVCMWSLYKQMKGTNIPPAYNAPSQKV